MVDNMLLVVFITHVLSNLQVCLMKSLKMMIMQNVKVLGEKTHVGVWILHELFVAKHLGE
jgi:hypothetical protein